MNHLRRLCLGQFVAYVMYGKGCTKRIQHPLTFMSTWKEIPSGVHLLGRNLVVVMSQSYKVRCSVYGTRHFNTKITPLDPQCIYSFQVIILVHPHYYRKRLSRTGRRKISVDSVQYTTKHQQISILYIPAFKYQCSCWQQSCFHFKFPSLYLSGTAFFLIFNGTWVTRLANTG